MPLRTRIFIMVSILVFVVLAVSLMAVLIGKKKPGTTTSDTTTTNTYKVIDSSNFDSRPITAQPTIPNNPTVKVATTLEAEQNGAKQLAKIFVERYSSYSNESNYANVYSVQDIVTSALWKKISAVTAKPAVTTGPYNAVTTAVVNMSLGTWSTTEATVTLKAKKTIQKDATFSEQYQDFTVTLTKSGSKWLVDSYTSK